MKIVSTAKIKNNVKIVLDNEETVYLRYEIFFKNGLRKGEELTQERIDALILQNRIFFVRESAFRFLAMRLHSTKELERKLSAKKYEKEIIAQVLQEMTGQGYLDDEKFAHEFIDELLRKKKTGRIKIKAALAAKGLGREIIDRVIGSTVFDEEREKAYHWAEKKIESLKGKELESGKLRQKLYSYLMSKGFDFDVTREAVDRLTGNEE